MLKAASFSLSMAWEFANTLNSLKYFADSAIKWNLYGYTDVITL